MKMYYYEGRYWTRDELMAEAFRLLSRANELLVEMEKRLEAKYPTR